MGSVAIRTRVGTLARAMSFSLVCCHSIFLIFIVQALKTYKYLILGKIRGLIEEEDVRKAFRASHHEWGRTPVSPMTTRGALLHALHCFGCSLATAGVRFANVDATRLDWLPLWFR
jgi:hypothetical protein